MRRIQRLIAERGISVRELSQRLKGSGGKATSPATIGRWLEGTGDPRLSELLAIAEFFDVPMASLVGSESREELEADESAALDLYREARETIGAAPALRELAKIAAAPVGLPPKGAQKSGFDVLRERDIPEHPPRPKRSVVEPGRDEKRAENDDVKRRKR